MRPHLSLDVPNVAASVQFYQKVFSVPPQKQTADYAKFDLTAPTLNFSVVAAGDRVSSVNHVGIEVDSLEEIAMWRQRLQEQGILERVEENTACSFARQDKLWFSDPDGNAWEVFTVHEQLDLRGPLSNTGCCVPKRQDLSAPATCSGKGDTPKTTPTAPIRPVQAAMMLLLLVMAAPFAWANGREDSSDRRSASAPTPVAMQNRVPQPALPADPDLAAVRAAPPNASGTSTWRSLRATCLIP